MIPTAFLRRLVAALELAGIPYMVVGSYAAMFHGVPRSTRDIDVVIDPDAAALERLLDALPADAYYVDADVARDALRRRSMFNIIDLETSWKADLVVCRPRRYSSAELARRRLGAIEDVPCFVATAEDTILTKLEWARESGSELQLRDVAGILETSGDVLDLAYLEGWAAELGVAELWARVRAGR